MSFTKHPDPLEELTLAALRKALQDYRKSAPVDGPLVRMLIYQKKSDSIMSERAIVGSIFQDAISRIRGNNSVSDDVIAKLIESYYLENKGTVETLEEIEKIPKNPFPVVNKTDGADFHNLMNPKGLNRLKSTLKEMEEKERKERHDDLIGRLLQAVNQIEPIGVNKHIDALFKMLISQRILWIYVVHGESGIGKTRIIQALMHHVSKQDFTWPEILWISFEPQSLPTTISSKAALDKELVGRLVDSTIGQMANFKALYQEQMLVELRKYFSKRNYIVVLDNVSTLAELQSLIPVLRKLANPTRFIVISQEAVVGVSNDNFLDIHNYEISKLTKEDGLILLQSLFSTHSIHVSQQCLECIYHKIGGNPKALLNVVAQIRPLRLNEKLLKEKLQSLGCGDCEQC